jgi:hypothetical protein
MAKILAQILWLPSWLRLNVRIDVYRLILSFHKAALAMRQQGNYYNAGLITRLAQHMGELPK